MDDSESDGMVCVRPGLFAIPITYYVCACSKTISTNSLNIAIHKNLALYSMHM